MYIEDNEFPWPHHPAVPDADGDGLVVDTSVTVDVMQLRPMTVQASAAWCGATVTTVNGGPALLLAGGVAGLGDFVVTAGGGRFVFEPADGFSQRYRPVDPPS